MQPVPGGMLVWAQQKGPPCQPWCPALLQGQLPVSLPLQQQHTRLRRLPAEGPSPALTRLSAQQQRAAALAVLMAAVAEGVLQRPGRRETAAVCPSGSGSSRRQRPRQQQPRQHRPSSPQRRRLPLLLRCLLLPRRRRPLHLLLQLRRLRLLPLLLLQRQLAVVVVGTVRPRGAGKL